MKERISLVRKEAGLTQEEFGARVGGLSRNYIWMIEKGDRIPSDRTITDICREFDINEEWLRTGAGEMRIPKTRDEELSAFFGDILTGMPDIRKIFISVMARLNEDEWKLVADIATKLVDEMKK